ncbi:MAG: hypothetical protein HFJ45_00500 [Clostridia bacterium]|nr:hypothetical protein [Clostridia bacterium]
MKKRQVITYIVVMCVLLCTSVYATISGEIGVSVKSKNEALYAGDEFSVTLSLNNLTTTAGLNAVEGYIDIDKNVLENLTIDSIETTDGNITINEDNVLKLYDASSNLNPDEGVVFNTNPASGKGDYRIVFNFAKKVTSDANLVTIKFKVKENVTPGTYKNVITYKEFKVFSEDDTTEKKKELTVQPVTLIVSEKKNTPADKNENNTVNNTVNEVNNVTNNATTNNTVKNDSVKNNTTNNIVNNIVENKTNESNSVNNTPNIGATVNNNTPENKPDNTLANTILPNTGYKLIVIPVIIIAIVGLVFYKKYSKYNKYN